MPSALVVAGARPNFMKVAPILRALGESGWEASLIHTGQHYDEEMSETFFRELDLPRPAHHLGVGSGTHAEQTARVMLAFEPVLKEVAPDWVLVVGDVNSTMACALVTAKLRPEIGSRLAHVEAGLRSRDWDMPEEINRMVTDQIADLLLLPSEDARDNLLREGIPARRIAFAGNVMIDSLKAQLPAALQAGTLERFGVREREFVVCTLHRPSNVDHPDRLAVVLEGLCQLAERRPVILPLHPRTQRNIDTFALSHLLTKLQVTPPLGYRDMLSLTAQCALVLTDSGGLQEETTSLGVPCVTLREQTERPVTVKLGTNRLVPWPLTVEGMVRCAESAAADRANRRAPPDIPGWDGHAAQRIVRALADAK